MDIKLGVNGVHISATLTNTSTTTQSFRVLAGWKSQAANPGGIGENADYTLAAGASTTVVSDTPEDLFVLMKNSGYGVLGSADVLFYVYSWPNGIGGTLVSLFTSTLPNAFNVVQ